MKKIENHTSEENLRFQTLIEHLQAGVVVHANDTRILHANKEASRILGLSIEQLKGKVAIDPDWYFVREDETRLPLTDYPVHKAISTLQSFENYIIGVKRPNTHKQVWVQVNAYPEFNNRNILSHVVVTFVDITEKVETQKALEESEATFSKVFQYSPGIIMITSLDEGYIFDTNNKIVHTGYSREDLIGHKVLDLNLWHETSVRNQFLQKIREEGKVENFEAKFKKKNGEIFICLISGEVIKFRNTSCIISILIDISERKQAEQEMNVLFEIVQGVVNTSDLHELLKLIHHSLKKILYAENCFFALYDKKTELFSFPYFVDQFDKPFNPRKLYKSCTSYVYQTGNSILITPEVFQRLTKEGEIKLVGSPSPSWIGIPLKTSSGIIGVMVLQHYTKENIYNESQLKFLDSIGSQVANVIERKRAENELEQSHSLITATLESTADGILVVDKTGKITNFNSKFIELWRIPSSIIQTDNDEALLSYVLDQLTDPIGFIDKVRELYENEDETSTDFLSFKDGRTFERYSQSQVFNGTCVGRVWSFRNITEQKNTLLALHDSESLLRELNATKDKFFSIIAHDLKSPFNGILGFSNILIEQIKQKDYEGIEEYSEIIQFSAQKAIDLLTNIMEWSRSQSGRMDFNPQNIDIGIIINEVFELSSIAASQKSIHFTKEVPHPIFVNLDKDMIASVLRNIISNSIKFTHPGGHILLHAVEEGNRLKVSVTDTGIGIEERELIKLFRIDESFSIPGTHNEKGTGLGLILCKEFVDKHKGQIWAESEPGHGSRFVFTIPIGDPNLAE
jgi:PAS domain S-box-containing protein